MNIIVDCNIYNTKKLLLDYFKSILDEMYSSNYDALIDALLFIDEKTDINILNIDQFNDKNNLIEVLNIISNNENISIKY
jgi:hypothetical protein